MSANVEHEKKRGLFLALILFFPLSMRADTPVEMLQSALDAYFNGRFEESVYFFEQILAVDPKNESAKRGLKNARNKKKEQVRQNREQERKALYAAEGYLAKGKVLEAFDRTEGILARASKLPEALALAKKIRTRAEKDLRKAKPESSVFHEAQGNLAYMAGDWFKAVDSWEKVLAFNKDRTDLLNRLEEGKKKLVAQQRADSLRIRLGVAQARMDKGLYAEARKILDEVLRLDATNAEARLLLNDARRREGQAAKAKVDSQVQEINQKAMDAFSEGRRSDSLALFNRVLGIDPDNRLAMEYKERILGRSAAPLDVTPVSAIRSGGADYAKASRLIEEEHFVEGIELLERYLNTQPNDVKCQQLLEKARRKQKDLAEGAYREALTAYSQGDRAEAIRLLKESRRFDPEFGRAKQVLVKIMQEGAP